MELAAIWGTESDGGGRRFPKRRRLGSKHDELDDDTTGDFNEELSEDDDGRRRVALREEDTSRRPVKKRKRERAEYRLHCFVEPGTEKNDVRMVFEAYNPKVELRTSQKGSILNKTQYAVLTFPNKAMALHAVQQLDGTNQRDMLGTPKMKLNLMLSREQSRIVRKKLNKASKKSAEEQWMKEVEEDAAFINKFLEENLQKKKKKDSSS